MQRVVHPELLDSLPADDPGAIGSRRDLQRLHAWMGHRSLMDGALRSAMNGDVPRRFVELGAGDGAFMLRVARQLAPPWPGLRLTMVDQQELVTSRTRRAFAELGWHVDCVHADVFDWIESLCSSRRKEALICIPHSALLAAPESSGGGLIPHLKEPPHVGCCDDFDAPDSATVILANLFLHHFDDARLTELFRGIAQVTETFIALEPRRSRLALTFSQQIWAIGCNYVSRHDAPVSVRAGFAGRELSRLWPSDGKWSLHERPAGLFSHLFIARRRA